MDPDMYLTYYFGIKRIDSLIPRSKAIIINQNQNHMWSNPISTLL
jgi:hypothetical protein